MLDVTAKWFQQILVYCMHTVKTFSKQKASIQNLQTVSSRLHQSEVNNWLLYPYTVLNTLQDTCFTALAQAASFVHSLICFLQFSDWRARI